MVLIQMLLPAAVRDLSKGEVANAFADTRRELAAKFDGLTAYLRSPARGEWTAPDGHVEQDDVVMVEVVATDFERGWWRRYATEMASRFRQKEIHVRALPMLTLDEAP